jgi:hypothetical protein
MWELFKTRREEQRTRRRRTRKRKRKRRGRGGGEKGKEEKRKRRGQLSKPKCRWENDKKLYFKQTGCEGVDWIYSAQDRDQLRTR